MFISCIDDDKLTSETNIQLMIHFLFSLCFCWRLKVFALFSLYVTLTCLVWLVLGHVLVGLYLNFLI